MRRREWKSLIRGILQMTFALLAAASFGGWIVMLGMFVGVTVTDRVIAAAFWILTTLYGLLAFALGNAIGRRQGERGLAAATIGALLTWGIFELNFSLWQIGFSEMRVPLMVGVAMAALGAAIGTTRTADRDALRVELQEEMQELERAEDEEQAPDPVAAQPGEQDRGEEQ